MVITSQNSSFNFKVQASETNQVILESTTSLTSTHTCTPTQTYALITAAECCFHFLNFFFWINLQVKAFRLEPGQRVGEPSKGGIIDSDGEVLARGEGTYMCGQSSLMAYDPIQMTVDKGLATMFSPLK